MFNPDYKSPRSVQMNIGIQHELRRGMVLSVDYARNVQTHYLLGVDQNHAGDIRYFNLAGAKTAIANTLAACGAAIRLDLPSGTYTNPDGTNRALNMGDFAANGLGSSTDFGGSSCPSVLGYRLRLRRDQSQCAADWYVIAGRTFRLQRTADEVDRQREGAL